MGAPGFYRIAAAAPVSRDSVTSPGLRHERPGFYRIAAAAPGPGADAGGRQRRCIHSQRCGSRRT